MWRYIRYLLLKSLQNLDLQIVRLEKECYKLTIPSRAISINFMIPKRLKRKDKNSEIVKLTVDTLKKQIKQNLFSNSKKIPKKKMITNKKERKEKSF